MVKFSRRWFFMFALPAVIALCLASMGRESLAAEKVNFALNWVPGPQHTEFVVAKYRGFFERQSLDVSMHPPAAATDPIKLVASGNDDFGIAYAADIIQARAQGVPIVSLVAIHRKITLGLMSRPEDKFLKPKDIEGKIIAFTPVPNNRAMFWDFVDKNGIDRDKIKVVTAQFNGPHVVAAGKADFADAVSWYELGLYRQLTGKRPNYMEFTDYGVPGGYFFCIITSEKVLQKKPEIISPFIKAVLEAEKWTLENPDEARKVLISNVEEVSEEFSKQSRGILDKIITDEDTDKNGLGWQSLDVWRTMVNFQFEEGLIEEKIDPSTAFTNEFLPETPIMVSK